MCNIDLHAFRKDKSVFVQCASCFTKQQNGPYNVHTVKSLAVVYEAIPEDNFNYTDGIRHTQQKMINANDSLLEYI